VLGATIMADLRAPIDSRGGTGPAYWAKVFLKAAITPAIHCIVLYRISSVLYRNPLTRPFAFVLRSMSIVWGGTEIHPAAKIGPGLFINHSQMVLIGEGVTLGSHVRLSHGVSIGGDPGRGAPESAAGWPVIGDGVTVGLHAIVMGPVTVGEHSVISAQALVVRDVPAHAVVAGSPARVVKMLDESLPKYGEAYQKRTTT
jgi:serine O-acetyltransferase